MASIWKRSTDRNRKGSCWYITYRDERSRPKTVRGYPDKQATTLLANQLEADADLRRRGVIDTRADNYAAHERQLLADHLTAWHTFLVGKGGTQSHADLSRNRVARLLDLAQAQKLSDLTPSKIQGALKALRDGGLSLRSIHHHVRVIKGFSRWLARDNRTRADELASLTAQNPDPDRRHVRRVLTDQDLGRLIRATETGQQFRHVPGPDRAWLYRVALATGFRASELASLTPESFDLTADPPTIEVQAGFSKRRRHDVQPIPLTLASAIAPWLATLPPGKPVWKFKNHDTALMIRFDLEAAGVPYRTSEGAADFHSLRSCYVTALVRSNVSVKVAQSLARHSTPVLTLNTYTHLGLFDQVAALEALPDLTAQSDHPVMQATGTDPAPERISERAAPAQRSGSGIGRLYTYSSGTAKGAARKLTVLTGTLKRPEIKAIGTYVRFVSCPGQRRRWDSNPRKVALHTLSKRAGSAALALLQNRDY